MRNLKDITIAESMVNQICVQSVNWELATPTQEITHVIDFGPGEYSGVGGLTARNKEGSGMQVILASALSPNSNHDILPKSRIFDCLEPLAYAQNWAKLYQPRLVRIESTNELHIETSFSRLLGNLIY